MNTPNAWELASQLSYTLWNTMPADELFALAVESKLLSRTVLLAQVRRMLNDPRARDMVADFHNQFMDAKKFVNLQRDAKAFPNFATALGAAMQKEVELFCAAAVLEDNLPFEALLKAPFTYADASLAKLYGVAAPTNLGFLTSHAHQDASAPILRGTFVLKNVLCMEPPPPPPEVDLTLPMPEPGMTTSQFVSFTGAQQPAPMADSPWKLYQDFMGLSAADPAVLERITKRRESVMDLVGLTRPRSVGWDKRTNTI